MWIRRRRHHMSHASREPVNKMLTEKDAKDYFSYEMLMQRELEQDAMLWQTPSLALTALAFLLTIALDFDSHAVARWVASGLGVVVVLLSMQLMAKHRFLSHLDRDMLTQLEERLRIEPIAKRRWTYSESGEISAERQAAFYEKWSSYRIWQFGLLVFLLANAALFAQSSASLLISFDMDGSAPTSVQPSAQPR